MLLVVTVTSEGLLLILTAQFYIKNNFVSGMWHFPCPALGAFLRVRGGHGPGNRSLKGLPLSFFGVNMRFH